jgi:signal peptidase II
LTDAAPPPTSLPRAASSKAAWLLLAAVVSLGVAIDLLSKVWAFEKVAAAPVHLSRQAVLGIQRLSKEDVQTFLMEHRLPPEVAQQVWRVEGPAPGNIGLLIPRHDAVTVVPGLLDFTLVLNPGAVFGMGAGRRLFFMAFTAVAMSFALWIFARWTRPRDRAAHVALGLLIAGGLGNFYDRWFYGCVRDFIHPLPGVKWPFGWTLTGKSGEVWPYVSNLADLFLIIGIGVLAVMLWRADTRRG